MTFNMFNVLGKDDKELVHSAYLKFLITEHPEIVTDFFELESLKTFKEPRLECSYTFTKQKEDGATPKKTQRCRMDLELESKDGEEIIVIENKFKAIPSNKQ